MKMRYTFTLLAALALLLAPSAWAQAVDANSEVGTDKRAQTGMKFLSLSNDARASAMGGAATAETVGSSVALFYNPAAMARMEQNFHVNLGVTQFITDINYNVASAAYKPAGSNGVFGLSFMSVDYGEFIGTVRADNEAGYIETGDYSPSAMAIGLGYARSFSDKFSAGLHLKYAFQDLGSHEISRQEDNADAFNFDDYSVNTVAVDFGILYNTGFRSLVIAMSTRNFSRELTYVRERLELPLAFQIGLRMNMLDFTSMSSDVHKLNLAVDAQRPRDFDEHLKLGLEYSFQEMFFLRGGHSQPFVDGEEEGVSFGAGFRVGMGDNMNIGVDYAYTDFGLFGNLNRFSLQLGF